ncbi:protease SohB [Marinimicrobium sp. ABcell2]|uniref:protease SohB n=1 Tax=Marinimicrobium sp. ABcell2 TaxID=3069751 RepID=UPI0027B25B92|nr:protease SohB [Marinimicrobium sp. ABcell2]MDQ2075711.1 protease SohB [Marinimicrobium sp. ABcell2]
MEFLAEYGLFLAKTLTFVLALAVIVSLIGALGSKGKKKHDKGHIEVTNLNDKFKEMADSLRHAALDKLTLKQEEKTEKKKRKLEEKELKKSLKEQGGQREKTTPVPSPKKRVFVLDFHGDIKASATENLRQEITSVLSLATESDEVVVKVESGGGMVHSYGLASSQLARITDRKIPLTVCVDKVAASGGYMMACVADKILAAPFAILGSIGVLAQVPNFNKLLKKNSIDYEMFTAGEYKRTVTMFGENTDKGRQKFKEDLEDIHVLFKEFVSEHRPQVDIAKVATGEIWFGRRATEVNLVDGLQTSDEYLLAQHPEADIYQVEFVHKKSLPEKFGFAAQGAVDRLLLTWWERGSQNRWF